MLEKTICRQIAQDVFFHFELEYLSEAIFHTKKMVKLMILNSTEPSSINNVKTWEWFLIKWAQNDSPVVSLGGLFGRDLKANVIWFYYEHLEEIGKTLAEILSQSHIKFTVIAHPDYLMIKAPVETTLLEEGD